MGLRKVGSRREVFNKSALRTSGGLEKKDLIKNRHGRIVSRKKHFTAKKEKRLLKHGYSAKKGKFGYVRVNSKKSRTVKKSSKSKRRRRRRTGRRR